MLTIGRRGFLQSLVGGIAAAAAVRTFPFRVFSFPTDVQLISADELPKIIEKLDREFELCGWNGAPSRILAVDLSRPFVCDMRTIPIVNRNGGIRILPRNAIDSKAIILTDS